MDVALIISGIRAVLRAAQSGAVLYAEHARDRAIFLPRVQLPELTIRTQLDMYLRENVALQQVDVFDEIWTGENGVVLSQDATVYDPAFAEMQKRKALAKLNADDFNDQYEAGMIGAGALVEQWRLSKEPPSVVARFALTIADIGLEFVSTNPSLFGVSGKGEALVVSFASHLEAIIPDEVGDFGSKQGFTNRLLGNVLRAALTTLAENPDSVFDDDNTRMLVTSFMGPVIASMPSDLNEYLNYQDVVDAMTGPAIGALLGVVAENPGQYLGDSVKNDKALSALSKAVISEAAKISVDSSILDLLGKEGMLSLYQAGMDVAITHPEIFINSDEPYADAYKALISGVASQLRESPKLDKTVVTGIASEVVKVVGYHAGTLFELDGDDSWDKVALGIIKHITADINTALTSPNGAQKLFTREDFKTMALIVVAEVNENPLMLGVESDGVQAIVKNVSQIMVADQSLLLTREDWLVVASMAAAQAAQNPGKLLDLDSQVLNKVLSALLQVASTTWQNAVATGMPKLAFGRTLMSMIEMVIEQMANNITGIKQHPARVSEFLEVLLNIAEENPDAIGSTNLLKVFGLFLAGVMETGTLPDEEEIKQVLGVA
jgi:hypothetical protein